LISVIGFTLASALCGAATSLSALVFFRAVQGVAGAGLVPLSQATLLQINPPERHGHAMAVFGIGTILGPIMGPALGGWLTYDYSWRWVFYINLPVGVLCTLGTLVFMRETRHVHREPFDFIGFITLSLGIGALQFMLDRGELKDWFDSREIWIEATVAGLGFYLFTVHTITAADNSFLNRDLLKSANFMAGTVLMFCGGLIMTGTLALLPTMLQNLMDYPALTTGLVTMPRGIGGMAAMFLVAPLNYPRRQPAAHSVRLCADRDLDVANEPVLAADGHDTGHHFRTVARFRPRLHPSAPEHHRVVDTATPHADPGNRDSQPDAQPRRQRRHQHSGRPPGSEYAGGSLASGRRPAAGQSDYA
jgi:MFS family permease